MLMRLPECIFSDDIGRHSHPNPTQQQDVIVLMLQSLWQSIDTLSLMTGWNLVMRMR